MKISVKADGFSIGASGAGSKKTGFARQGESASIEISASADLTGCTALNDSFSLFFALLRIVLFASLTAHGSLFPSQNEKARRSRVKLIVFDWNYGRWVSDGMHCAGFYPACPTLRFG